VNFATKLLLELLVSALGTFGGSVAASATTHNPKPVIESPTKEGETFRERVRDCQELDAEIASYLKEQGLKVVPGNHDMDRHTS